tara:strand:+ start:379 stop:966 length:588 start_codon:yes stop_codon:yes gene_type:complete
MPNWMENKLTIYGKENDLNTFKKSVTSTWIKRDFIKTDDLGDPVYQESKVECMLDFNMIVPMPKEFEETEAPSEMIDKKLKDELKKKYGHSDWYSWRNCNWGTKWNIDPERLSFEIEHKKSYKLVYNFPTAWDAPKKIILAAAEKFPLLLFMLEYLEYVESYKGILICQDNLVILDLSKNADIAWSMINNKDDFL